MQDTPEERLPPSLRILKALVILLTLTMIGGVITVVALLVTRMPSAVGKTGSENVLALPDALSLPNGAKAEAVTKGKDWFAVVTTDQHILIFNSDGSLRQDIPITPAP